MPTVMPIDPDEPHVEPVIAVHVLRQRSTAMTQRAGSLRVADHAVLRFQERVHPGASLVEARMAIQQIARLGKASSRPRHWMCDTRSAPGTVYMYWQQRPGVALLVRDGCVVTVYTRELTRGAARRRRDRNREARIHLRLLDPVVDVDDWELSAWAITAESPGSRHARSRVTGGSRALPTDSGSARASASMRLIRWTRRDHWIKHQHAG